MRTLSLMLILAITLNCYSQEKTNQETPSKVSDEIAKVIKSNTTDFPQQTQLSIAVINEDNTEYVGVIKGKDALRYVDNKHSVFEIGSISKVFTSVLLSQAIKENKLSKKDSLKNVLNFELKSGHEITLEQLTNHTSGLPRLPNNIMFMVGGGLINPYKDYTPELLETYLKDQVRLTSKTGKRYAYSNLGAGLLGYILTLKYNKSYEDLLQGNILKPLQMNNSSSVLENIDKANLIKGLNAQGEVVSNWDFTDALVGAGGIKSSVFDLNKFIRKNLTDNAIYNLTQQSTFTINERLDVGMGWHILNENNDKIYLHSGATGGYFSYALFNKKTKKGVIILSNVSASHPKSSNIEMLAFQILKSLTK